MYTPPMFKPDRAASLAFAEARGFGTVCAWDGSRPVASSLPFYLDYADDGTPLAAFHVARHNALAGLADGTSSWLMAVNGADAYISPDWYASPDQVPTWLYQAVHLTGTVRKQSDDELGRHLDALSGEVRKLAGAEAAMVVVEDDGRTSGCDEEGDRGSCDDGGSGRGQFQAQPAQIRPRPRRHRDRAVRQKEPAAQILANEMRGLRPQLFESQTSQLNAKTTPEGAM